MKPRRPWERVPVPAKEKAARRMTDARYLMIRQVEALEHLERHAGEISKQLFSVRRALEHLADNDHLAKVRLTGIIKASRQVVTTPERDDSVSGSTVAPAARASLN